MNDAVVYNNEIEPLSERETKLLVELEGHIEEHLRGFKIVGYALATIKEQRLYRLDYDTFEEYCASKWDLSRPRAYQLADCYEVVHHLSTMVDKHDEPLFTVLPENERQVRPLTPLPMDQWTEVWMMVVEEAKQQRVSITGAFVQRCIDTWRQKTVKTRIEGSTRTTTEISLPDTLATSFNAFIGELKTSSNLAADPRYKRELVKMLKELLDVLEG